MNIFEQATRDSLRFMTAKGALSVEDIWHLPLTSANSTSLDSLATEYYAELQKAENKVSFVNPSKLSTATTQLQFDIVKHILEHKVAERDDRATAAAKAEKKQKLLALLERKEDDELNNLSVEELRKQVESL